MSELMKTTGGQDGLPLDRSLPVFERLGLIVRALHDTLAEIGVEESLAHAVHEFPNARERLNHVASLTEQAAHAVLSKIEETVPQLDRLGEQAAKLLCDMNQSAAERRQVAFPSEADIRSFLVEVQEGCAFALSALSAILMAQDFQDLTGQLIKKVGKVLERTETDLLRLLVDAAPPGMLLKEAREEVTAGPGVTGGAALDQSSVDDLLSGLGF